MPSSLANLARAVVCIEEALRVAREEGHDLSQENVACQFADDARRLLDGLRTCSECHRASGNGSDVCDGCWPVYQARLEQEDREAEYREATDDDDDHLCADCGRPLPSYADFICESCRREQAEEAEYRDEDDLTDAGYEGEDDGFDEFMREITAPADEDDDFDVDNGWGNPDDRDWEGEALALEEARRDVEVDPFGDAFGQPYDDGQDGPDEA